MELVEPITTVDNPVVARLRVAPVMAVQPTGEAVPLTAAVTPPPAIELAPDPAPAEVAMAVLPATSSMLPLIAMFGLLALAGAWVLGRMQKRVG
jgi:hypothetical protein